MPGWSNKSQRMFEHIKESSMERGVPEEKAEEIAGRTVNKQRRLAGQTPNKRTQGIGNPNLPLAEHKRDELYNLARERGITGRSKMNKEQLARAIEAAE